MESLIATYSLRPVNILELIFAFSALFGCVLLWANERFRGICLILLLEAALMLFNFSEETGLFKQTYLITPAFSLCTGPMFFLFIKHLVYTRSNWSAKELVHFAPAILALGLTSYTQWILALGTLSLIGYGINSFLYLRRYHIAADTLSSDAQNTRLHWLVYFMVVFAILGLQDMVRINSQPFLDFDFAMTWYFFHQFAVWLTFLALIYLAVKQPEVFDQLETYEQLFTEKETVASSDLDKALFAQIDNVVKDKKLFTQPRLSLLDLANETGLGVKDVSGAINAGANKSFSEYVNTLRVKEVLTILEQEQHATPSLLNAAFMAGFNSKSSFNAVFKSQMQMTPSQFIKSRPPDND